jgi:hypothetical protein
MAFKRRRRAPPPPVAGASAPAAPAQPPVEATPVPAQAPTQGPPVPEPPEPEATPPTEAGAAPAAAQAPVQRWPDWVDHVAVGGGAILYFYEPINVPAKPTFEVYFAYLLLDGAFDHFGMHLETRFRDTKLRPFFDGPVWMEEVYAWLNAGPLTFKAGKTYSRLGLFWDNSFYGNVQAFDGLKLDPDYGLSVEGATGGPTGLAFAAQYFVVDGRTNISVDQRDTISIPGARRRNMFVGRLDPYTTFGSDGKVRVGLSYEHLTADLPDGAHDVDRYAFDAAVTGGGVGLWGELCGQNGETVTDFPIAGVPATATTPAVPGQPSTRNIYMLGGGQYTWAWLTLRYNFSEAQYTLVSVTERIHEPGVAIRLHENLTLLGELVLWSRATPTGTFPIDRSLNVTLTGHF